LQLKRPRREDRDSPNLPTVLGHGIEPGDRISRGATIVSKGRQAFLITVLDALAFESGQRTVDIALVEAAGGKECAVIPNVDSFRFRWIDDVPDHCAVELREEEIALIRKCEVWAFFDQPEIKEPEGDGNPAAGARLSATGMGVDLRRGEGPRRYDAIASMTELDPDAANTLDFAPIDPPADARLAGTCFVHDMGSGWVWLAGIGTEGNGAAPMTTVLGEPAVARIVDSVADGSARPVTELLMLERHLRRTGIPPGYAGLREFLSENGAAGLVRWKEVQASRGNHESAYRIERRAGVDGDRVVAAVSRNPSHDLSMNLEGSGAGARWRGADVASAPDAAVGVSAQEMGALGPDEAFELTLRIDNTSPETAQILVIEATAIGPQTPALPTAAPR
jgi:hypothetical protein